MYSFSRIDTDPIGTTPQQSFNNYTTALFAHVNGASDKELAARAKRTFGDIPAYNKEQDSFIGRALVSNAGYTGDPFSYLRNNNRPIPENTLTEYELYHYIGKEFVSQSRAEFAKAQATAVETRKQQEKAIINGLKTIPAILAEHRLPTAKEMAELTNAGLGDRLHKAFTDTLEALDTINTFNTVTQEDIDAEVVNLKSKERQDYINNNKFAGLTGEIEYKPRHDDAWYQQQARANKQQGYKLTREQMQSILTALRDENGKLDPISISLFVSTLNEKINKEQTLDSAFWRNVAQGASDFLTDTNDFAVREYNRLLATTGTYLGTDGEYHRATPEQITQAKEWLATYGSKEIETLRAGLNSVQQKAFEAAPDSSWIDAVLTGTGSIIGQEAIPLAAGTLGGLGGIIGGAAVGAVTRYPSIASRNISQAYADNKPNAHAYALIASAPESSIESIFNAAAASSPIKKGLEYLGTKALSVPLLAQTAGVIQSSALLRYTSASLLEGVGELFIEDPAATLTNAAIFRAINKMAGRNIFAAPGWSDVQKAIASNTDNPRQATSIVAYSFLLGAFGIGADAAKAHQFALNRDQLLDSGFSQTAATEISRKAENISEQLGEIDRNPELSLAKKLQQKQEILQNFSDWQKNKLNSDILNAKFEDLQKRYKANNLAFMDKAEATLAIETGAADAVLKADGIIKSEISPTGNRILTHTYQEQNAAGANEIKTETIELNPTQYLNYIAARTSQQQRAAITSYQNALLGNAAVRKARTTSDITHDLINLKDLAPVSEAYAHIARKGAIDYQGAQLIAKAVAAKRNELINSGMTLQQANASADTATGATLGSLATIADAFRNRVETAAETSEGQAKGITTADAAESIAMRLPSAKSIGDSIVLYSEGEITLAELTEELVESDLEKAIANGTPLNTIRDNLLHVQTQLRQYNDNIKLFPTKDKEKLTRQDIIEAYSTLQAIDLIHRADRLPLTPTAKTIIKYALGQSELARATRVLGDAWATYANSKDGQTYLTTTGKTLSDLLDTAGISQSKLYSDLRVAEEDRIAVETAQNFNPISALEQQQKNLDTAAAEADTAATTNTEAGLPRTEIPAEESVTGEPIAVDPLETADNDPTTGEYTPSPLDETGTDPAFNGITSKSPFGITTGMMPPANLKPHPALPTPQNRPSSIDHRTSTYNPNAKPILALRMPDGSNLIVAGRTRHQIALADKDCKAVKVTLIDYDPAIHTDAWVQMTNAGEHIINRTATTEHYRTYFTHNPITHAQAIEQGLVPIDPKTGQPTAAYTKGRQLAEHTLTAKAEADAAAAAAAAAEAKAKAEKQLPGQTKWATPSKKSKPLSDSETKQTLISVAALCLSKYKNDRFQFTHTLTQRKNGTEYTVATDGRRITIISQPTYKPDTDDTTQEWHSNKGEKSKENQQAPKWTQVIPSRFRGETSVDFSYYSFLAKGLKGPAKNKHIDSPLLNNNQFIVVNSTNGFLSLNSIYVRDAYKQIVDLGKKFGFSPIVKLQYDDVASPVKFSAEHNGIKWQYVLMPVHRTEEVTPGDIILGEQPSIYSQQETLVSSPQAQALFQDGVMQTANAIVTEPGATLSIRALHASPHNFRKFSTEFMGSGEGAQAFGWGLYFMSNVRVNKAYFAAFNKAATNLTDDFKDLYKELKKISITIPHIAELKNNKQIKDIITSLIEINSDLKQAALKSLSAWNTFTHPFSEERNAVKEELAKRPKGKWARFFFNYDGIRKALERYAKQIKHAEIYAPEITESWERRKKNRKREVERISVHLEEISQKLEKLQELQVRAKTLVMYSVSGQKATNYRVELNVDDSNLLMWDEPISDELMQWIKKLADFEWDAPSTYRKKLNKESFDRLWNLHQEQGRNFTGQMLYGYLSELLRVETEGDAKPKAKKAASETLAKRGYKGIKYLDGISRKAGEGTYNYVIFSGDDIKITAVNETGVWSMDEGWQDYTDPTATFSLRRRPDRNLASILSNREKTLLQVSTYIKRHANRTARVIGADSDKLRAGVHFAQASAIIAALDKYIFPQDLISRGSAEYRKLKDLRALLEEFVRIAQKGKLPARRQTKDGRETTKARIRALLDAQMKQAPTLLAEDGSTQPDMTAKDIRKDLITRLAKEDAAQVLAVMMDGLGQIIETHLRNSILDKISTSLKAMRPKANAYGRYKRNSFSADTQRKLDLTARFINLKESEKADIQDQLDYAGSILSVIAADLSAPNPPSPQSILKTLPDGIVKQAYEHLVSRGGEVTIDMLEDAITSISNTFQTFAYLDEGSFRDALRAYMHLNELVTDARFSWDAKTAADRDRRNAYIEEAIAAVPQQIATANYREKKKTNALGSFFDNLMSAGQLFYSLAGTDGFRSVAMNTMSRIASASPAILTAQKEIEYSLVEAYLRCFKPGIHANLPEDTKARQAIIRKHLNKDFNAFVVDMQKELDTGIILEPELAPSVKAVRERQGANAPKDFTQTLKLSKFEALNIILTGEQPEYQKNLLYHGYTPEVMSQLREMVGDELMEFGYFMRSLLINSGVTQVYAERTGHNLPDNPYYWPSHIDHITHSKGESKPDENKFRTAGTDNFLKKRVVSMGEIKPIDALTVFRNNMTERLNYIYMRPITDEWRSLLSNPHFAHRLEGSIGKDRMKKLRAALDVLDNAAAADAYMNGVFNKLISSFHSARAVSLLSGNIGTFIRQATAFNHVGILTNSGLASYSQTVIDTFNGKTQISLSEMLNTPQFQARYQNSKFYEELQREAENASWNKIKQTALNISNLGMEAIGRVDTWANAVSACVYYNVRHKEYSSQYPNLTKQELHDKCMQDVAIMLELVAQPLLQHQKSLYAATTTNAIIKAGCFMGTELLNKLGMARAAYLKAGGGFNGTLAQAKVLAAVGIPAAIINILLAWLNDEMPDDEVDKYAFLTSQTLQGATGISILFNLPLFGGFVSQAFQPSYYNKGEWQNILPDVSNTATHYGNLFKICTGENSSWTNEELAKTINQCSRDAAQLASLAQTLPFLRETTSTISAAMGAVAAASNTLRVPASVAGNIINSDKRIPDSKNNTRKKSYRQPVMEKLLSEHIFADKDYEKRKAAAKRERSRHTRNENRKKKAAERKANQQQNRI